MRDLKVTWSRDIGFYVIVMWLFFLFFFFFDHSNNLIWTCVCSNNMSEPKRRKRNTDKPTKKDSEFDVLSELGFPVEEKSWPSSFEPLKNPTGFNYLVQESPNNQRVNVTAMPPHFTEVIRTLLKASNLSSNNNLYQTREDSGKILDANETIWSDRFVEASSTKATSSFVLGSGLSSAIDVEPNTRATSQQVVVLSKIREQLSSNPALNSILTDYDNLTKERPKNLCPVISRAHLNRMMIGYTPDLPSYMQKCMFSDFDNRNTSTSDAESMHEQTTSSVRCMFSYLCKLKGHPNNLDGSIPGVAFLSETEFEEQKKIKEKRLCATCVIFYSNMFIIEDMIQRMNSTRGPQLASTEVMVNSFCVQTDSVGEFCISDCIKYKDQNVGIFGNIPLYDPLKFECHVLKQEKTRFGLICTHPVF